MNDKVAVYFDGTEAFICGAWGNFKVGELERIEMDLDETDFDLGEGNYVFGVIYNHGYDEMPPYWELVFLKFEPQGRGIMRNAMNEINPYYVGSPRFLLAIAMDVKSDRLHEGYLDSCEDFTPAEQEATTAAWLASTGCIDPPEEPEVQNPGLRNWIRHCRLTLGSVLANSKLGLPFDPTVPIGLGKSEALLTVAKIDHKFGVMK